MKTTAIDSYKPRLANRSSRSEDSAIPILKSLRSLALPAVRDNETTIQLAEAQASYLRELLGSGEGRFDASLLGKIPRVEVRTDDILPVAGTVYWTQGSWHIELNGNDSEPDRRFALLHEFKHIIDHPLTDRLYTGTAAEAARQQEQAADYFAACVLVPEDQLRQAAACLASVTLIGAYFEASETCIEQRLHDVGLTQNTSSHPIEVTS
jgi:hypothetical protein